MMAGAPHPNVAAALATIARTEGPGALFNGVLLSAVIKQAPQMAITFATYEVGSLLGDPTVHFACMAPVPSTFAHPCVPPKQSRAAVKECSNLHTSCTPLTAADGQARPCAALNPA